MTGLLFSMATQLYSLTLHVLNVWQTSEWYGRVFDLPAAVSANGTVATLCTAAGTLTFVAHDAQDALVGVRRPNSFLQAPPAMHLHLGTDDVATLFDRAVAHGAVAVLDPIPDAAGHVVATLRDLNGILVVLTERETRTVLVG